jgi:PhoH-like ATPase
LYTGITELIYDDESMAKFYEGKYEQNFYTNQYIIIKNLNSEIIDTGKWNGEKFVPLKYRKMESDYFGAINALSEEQKFAFDLLQDDSIRIKMILSPYGCGKTFLSLVWALNEINSKKSKYQTLRYTRNMVPTKDSVDIGALPGTSNEKLMPWAMEIADVLGDESILDMYITQGKIILENIGFCRGRSWDNTIIFSEESQNLTPYLLSLLLGRTGKNSCFIMVGDLRQTDKDVFKKNSGIEKAVEKLKGNKLFGMVTLSKNERSEVSSLADLLLED